MKESQIVRQTAMLLLSFMVGCGSGVTGMLPGDYSGTVFCTSTLDLALGGVVRGDRTFEFEVGIRADGELLVGGLPVQVGERLFGVRRDGGYSELVVREVLSLSTVVIITYDESDVLENGDVVEGVVFEEFHFTPPTKILYLRKRTALASVGDLDLSDIYTEDCEGFLVP